MNYKMNLILTQGNEERAFNFDCVFTYDEDQYGNGYYVSVVDRESGFDPLYLDIRYDTSFNTNNKAEWLEEWAKLRWSGKNGAWSVKSIDVKHINKED